MEVLHSRQRTWDELIGLLGPTAREVRMLPDGRRMAALVPREQADQVRQAVTDWAQERSDVEVTVTGPWPPFSFCEEAEDS